MSTQDPEAGLQVGAIYAELGVNYRFFLTWRHRLFAGYFALIAALAIAYSWLVPEHPTLLWIPFATAILVSILFWALEYRNRSIYRNILDSAEACERGLPEDVGTYTVMRTKRRGMISHSTTMDAFYGIMVLAMVIGLYASLHANSAPAEQLNPTMQPDRPSADRPNR